MGNNVIDRSTAARIDLRRIIEATTLQDLEAAGERLAATLRQDESAEAPPRS